MKLKLVFIPAWIFISLLGSGCSNAIPVVSTSFPMPSTPVVQEFVLIQTPDSSDLQPVSVNSSSSLPDSPAAFAVDGDPETIWNSGDGPEQWIQLDLGAPTTIHAIRLLVSQYPAGESVHQIWAGVDPDNLTLLQGFSGFTNDGDLLEFIPITPPTNIQFIKIITTQSSSWVAWREIGVEIK